MSSLSVKRKVLLMGKSGSGKTSMRSIIFANYIARDTMRLGATIDVEHSHVRFLGNLVLNLWDCGGQEAFMENYLTSQRDHIFRNVEVLIYIFDVESRELQKDLMYYRSCVEALQQNSTSSAKVFCLIHKMDLIPEEQRDAVFEKRAAEIRRETDAVQAAAGGVVGGSAAEDIASNGEMQGADGAAAGGFTVTCFRTSIWDETLYKAWSSIVYSLVPNVNVLESHLTKFCDVCEADEVVLFERATFLVISYAARRDHRDDHRFEKISNIIKQFKLSCSKSQAQVQSMELKNTNYTAFVDLFTTNTYILVISSDPNIYSAATLLNIRNARDHFEKFIASSTQTM